jgi:hypothetical protein
MATLIPAGFAEVSFRHQFLEGGTIAICTMGMNLNGGTGTNTEKLEQVTEGWWLSWKDLLSNAVNYLGTTTRIGVAGSEPIIVERARVQLGLNPNAMLTRNTAGLVRKITNRGGRRGRGRFFVPAILQEAAVDQAGNLTTAMRGLVQTASTGLYNKLVVVGGGAVLLHDDQAVSGYNPSTGKPVYVTIDPGPPSTITDLIADPRAATQRRRMR